ncbi:putative pyrroloquinoline-quinone binding quinoprotein [Breznakibacter xylanolyticus]|uniref:Putative pyrroloquinoline-quinone binding quinoprotein n=1 Tax=Breznakibacter xylanolyticus TaxID=990 RepID=A0A2W7MPZ5_9BACT|nr:PQQ-binding-like beta-propeller repeat protein [Breznakibacter xylanolyticus]PZX09653.1 putative pyrroloquinoline-quinone binding quinoprotein [Breznakibacter xylanolyticus]
MRRTINSIAFLLISLFSFSQNGNIEIQISKKTIGKSLINNQEIISETFTFPNTIEKLELNCNKREIVIYLRGVSSNGKWLDNEGDYIHYDLKEKKIRWTKRFSYSKMNWYTQTDSLIVFTSGFRSWLLDYNTGTPSWKTNNNIYYLSPQINVGIAHGFLGNYGGPLIRGINLENGQELWHEELADNQGWKNMILLNDSIALLVSKGITLLNLKAGKIWQNTDIIKSKEPDSYTKQSFNLYKSILTCNFSKYQNEYNRNTYDDIIFVDSATIYIVTSNLISSISLATGVLNWEKAFSSPYEKMNVTEDIDKFYIFQKVPNEIGTLTSYILCVNKSNGEIIDEKLFNNQIDDYSFISSMLYYISNGEIHKYDLLTKKEEIIKNYSSESIGKFKCFVDGKKIYKLQDGILKPYENEVDNGILILSEYNELVELNRDLSINSNLNRKDLFFLQIDSGNYKLVNQDSNSYLINDNGQIIAKLNITPNAIIKNDIVFDYTDNALNVFDLDNLNIK